MDDSTPNVGDSVVFTVVVTNRGPDNATGVTVEDAIRYVFEKPGVSSVVVGTLNPEHLRGVVSAAG